MVVGSLSRAALHATALPGLEAAFAFLSGTDFSALADGAYPVGDGRIRAIVQSYATKPIAEARLEAHRRFLDIQFLLSGEERIGYAPIEHAGTPLAPFDDAKDIVFFDGAFEPFTLRTGDFALFFPHDAHAPGIRCGTAPAPVRKVVVKVPVATPEPTP
ncbi:MAG: YhcH/YjgK/YiaL family protein [Kiritimatiellia bacterium]|jgi:YhcH/YjgK/YiaL family protein